MRQFRPIPLALASTLFLAAAATTARADDPAAALEQLKQGYALREAGKCSEAMPHFVESERLDPQPKTLLNLADCEDRLGDLVSSQKHAVEARDLARQRGNAELLAIAEKRIAEVDTRLPRLTIRIARGAPPNTTVSRDGTPLGSVSLGVALPLNPGKHLIVAGAPGHADNKLQLTLAERASQTIEVEPSVKLQEPSASPSPQPGAALRDKESTAAQSTWTTRKTIAATLAGVGVAGLAVGAVFGRTAISKNDDSYANGHCDQTGCDATGKALRNDGLSDATASTIAFGAGATMLAAGVVLWLTAPVEVSPSVGPGQAGLRLRTSW